MMTRGRSRMRPLLYSVVVHKLRDSNRSSLNEQLLWQQLHDDHRRRSPVQDQRAADQRAAVQPVLQRRGEAALHVQLPPALPPPAALHQVLPLAAATLPPAAHAQARTLSLLAQPAHARVVLVQLVRARLVHVQQADVLPQARALRLVAQQLGVTRAHHEAHQLAAQALRAQAQLALHRPAQAHLVREHRALVHHAAERRAPVHPVAAPARVRLQLPEAPLHVQAHPLAVQRRAARHRAA